MSTVNCRSCGSPQLEVVLSLGQTPLANSLLTKAQLKEPEATYPLDLAFCRACSLLQITETVPPETLFRDYLYFSSFSDTMLKHSEELADELIESRGLNGQSLVVEVASNDGYLLQYFVARGIPVLGIEPAANVAAAAVAKEVPTRVAFFGRDTARELVGEGHDAVLDVVDLFDGAEDLGEEPVEPPAVVPAGLAGLGPARDAGLPRRRRKEEPGDRVAEAAGEGHDLVGGEPPAAARVDGALGLGEGRLRPAGAEEGLEAPAGFSLAPAPGFTGPGEVVGDDLVGGEVPVLGLFAGVHRCS